MFSSEKNINNKKFIIKNASTAGFVDYVQRLYTLFIIINQKKIKFAKIYVDFLCNMVYNMIYAFLRLKNA